MVSFPKRPKLPTLPRRHNNKPSSPRNNKGPVSVDIGISNSSLTTIEEQTSHDKMLAGGGGHHQVAVIQSISRHDFVNKAPSLDTVESEFDDDNNAAAAMNQVAVSMTSSEEVEAEDMLITAAQRSGPSSTQPHTANIIKAEDIVKAQDDASSPTSDIPTRTDAGTTSSKSVTSSRKSSRSIGNLVNSASRSSKRVLTKAVSSSKKISFVGRRSMSGISKASSSNAATMDVEEIRIPNKEQQPIKPRSFHEEVEAALAASAAAASSKAEKSSTSPSKEEESPIKSSFSEEWEHARKESSPPSKEDRGDTSHRQKSAFHQEADAAMAAMAAIRSSNSSSEYCNISPKASEENGMIEPTSSDDDDSASNDECSDAGRSDSSVSMVAVIRAGPTTTATANSSEEDGSVIEAIMKEVDEDLNNVPTTHNDDSKVHDRHILVNGNVQATNHDESDDDEEVPQYNAYAPCRNKKATAAAVGVAGTAAAVGATREVSFGDKEAVLVEDVDDQYCGDSPSMVYDDEDEVPHVASRDIPVVDGVVVDGVAETEAEVEPTRQRAMRRASAPTASFIERHSILSDPDFTGVDEEIDLEGIGYDDDERSESRSTPYVNAHQAAPPEPYVPSYQSRPAAAAATANDNIRVKDDNDDVLEIDAIRMLMPLLVNYGYQDHQPMTVHEHPQMAFQYTAHPPVYVHHYVG